MAKKPLPDYCDNWACAAAMTCRHHLGRSDEYGAMAINDDGTYPFTTRNFAPNQEAVRLLGRCLEFEYDERVRPWLLSPRDYGIWLRREYIAWWEKNAPVI